MAAANGLGSDPPAPYVTWLEHFQATVEPAHPVLGSSLEAIRRRAKVETLMEMDLQDASHIPDLFHPTSMKRFGFEEVPHDPDDRDMMELYPNPGGPDCRHIQGHMDRRWCRQCSRSTYRYLYRHAQIVCYEASHAGLPTLLGQFKSHGNNQGSIVACCLCEPKEDRFCPLSFVHEWAFGVAPDGTFRVFEMRLPSPDDSARLMAIRQQERRVFAGPDAVHAYIRPSAEKILSAAELIGRRLTTASDHLQILRNKLSQVVVEDEAREYAKNRIEEDMGEYATQLTYIGAELKRLPDKDL